MPCWMTIADIGVFNSVKRFIARQQWKTLLAIVIVWGVLAKINHFFLFSLGLDVGTSSTFPISEFWGPTFIKTGLLFLLFFLIILIWLLKYAKTLTPKAAYFFGAIFILLGNLAQGGGASGLMHGLTLPTMYYHDALLVDSWQHVLQIFTSEPIAKPHGVCGLNGA